MRSEAVMVPPGLLMRTMRALMSSSPSAFCSSSRTRATIGTLGGGAVNARLALDIEEGRAALKQQGGSDHGRDHSHRGSITRLDRCSIIGAMNAITIDDVREAARRLKGHIHRTPVITSRSFDEASGHRVFFKCENLQRAGAFKIRGALNKLLTLTDAERKRGVVGFSSGNHAQGVALAAKVTGASAIILMPTDAPALKVAATRGYGAEVVFYERQTEDREARAKDLVATTGRVLVPPYDDPAIMAGQGTAALELLEEAPDLDALLTPMGGGGLMAGCSTVATALRPSMKIYGVEADTANDTYLSFKKGERVSIAPPPTIADGIRNLSPGVLTFPINKQNVTDVLLVSDREIEHAVRFLLLRAKILVEPTGAVPAAALLAGKLPMPKNLRVGVVLSGGNIDSALLAEILTRS